MSLFWLGVVWKVLNYFPFYGGHLIEFFPVRRLCGFDIVLGESIKDAVKNYTPDDVKLLLQVYENKKYMLFVSGKERKVYVSLEKGSISSDFIAAYFHAVCLAIATSIYNSLELVNWVLSLYNLKKSYVIPGYLFQKTASPSHTYN